MKKNYEWKFWKHIILSISIVIIAYISDIIARRLFITKLFISFANKFNGFNIWKAASIGVIGASDGPTSVLVNSITSTKVLIYSKLILFVILVLLYLPLKAGINKLHKKDNNSCN